MDIETFNNDPIYQRYMSKMASLRPDQAASINAVIDNLRMPCEDVFWCKGSSRL